MQYLVVLADEKKMFLIVLDSLQILLDLRQKIGFLVVISFFNGEEETGNKQ
ncbi:MULTISPECIES: hypothetical protein [unclassified Okeania]|uniref:hypothetical protein n=1 Tax=unclassified Okeania TaxID=2634635 RepID=UPI00257D8D0C|nr:MULTISPECIES: hypothetical protein [unclassified Okeania]